MCMVDGNEMCDLIARIIMITIAAPQCTAHSISLSVSRTYPHFLYLYQPSVLHASDVDFSINFDEFLPL